MSEYELPLVFFTVLCQWATGSIVAITLLCFSRPEWLSDSVLFNKLGKMAIAVLLVNIVGSVLSLLHLGSPTGAYRAVLGIGHSWLSREVVAFFLLNGIVVLWAAIVFRFNRNRSLVKAISVVASVAGLAAIMVSAQVYYQMASHPMWHSIMTHLNFIATALLLGFVSVSLMVAVNNRAINSMANVPGSLLTGVMIGVLLVLVVMLWYAAGLNGKGQMLHSAMAVFASGLFGWLVIAGLITGTVIATYLYKQPTLSATAASVAMLLVLSAAVCGRMLFYLGVMSLYPWF
ncbi:dimethyl sulfoxide reductase anchor subunit family protein [Budvicia diplopodorum]|uniref:dimethyl sulfoxide reductase anchor subunit family protein n=1 Tax=Budvicia diplopodorum TaxID=1119056 RepID=UPI001359F80A|nr:DmsC/YnfH family molybdoenzyme membrane anchor subunit [Budvicia diplopodorum]